MVHNFPAPQLKLIKLKRLTNNIKMENIIEYVYFEIKKYFFDLNNPKKAE